MGKTNYKFNEANLLLELSEYIDATYTQHYAKGKDRQTLENIIDAGHGEGFVMGNIQKYAERKKGTREDQRLDLLKIAHYAIIAMHIMDKESDQNEAQ